MRSNYLRDRLVISMKGCGVVSQPVYKPIQDGTTSTATSSCSLIAGNFVGLVVCKATHTTSP